MDDPADLLWSRLRGRAWGPKQWMMSQRGSLLGHIRWDRRIRLWKAFMVGDNGAYTVHKTDDGAKQWCEDTFRQRDAMQRLQDQILLAE